MLFESYRGQGYVRGAECRLPAHYREIQAVVDSLSHAAQLEMTDAIAAGDEVQRERAYGKWLAFRGILRAVEGRQDEWSLHELAMLARIDWEREQFRFPGIELFDSTAITEPGALPERPVATASIMELDSTNGLAFVLLLEARDSSDDPAQPIRRSCAAHTPEVC